MKKVNNLMHTRDKDKFQTLNEDRSLFQKIIEDMAKNAGDLSPIIHWHLVEKTQEELDNRTEKVNAEIYSRYEKDSYLNNFSSSNNFLSSWIGCVGMNAIDEDTFAHYDEFLNEIDHLNLYTDLRKDSNSMYDWKITDLGSVIDLNLISAFYEGDKPKTHVLEVGGGYGRLCEAILNIYQGQIKYVMVDSVPGSIMFSYLYLKDSFPDLKIGFYYNNDDFDMEKYDLYIVPSWHFEKLNNIKYDICVNVESLQEMGQHHVDYYLNLFNDVTNDNGLIYISNAHDYVFKGKWNYPQNWERLFCFNTPRSWTKDHPTELFKKNSYSSALKNRIIKSSYDYSVKGHTKELKKRIKEEIYEELNEKVKNEIREELNKKEKRLFIVKYANKKYIKLVAETRN